MAKFRLRVWHLIVVVVILLIVLSARSRTMGRSSVLPGGQVNFEMENGITPIWVIPFGIDSTGDILDKTKGWTTFTLTPDQFKVGYDSSTKKTYSVVDPIFIQLRRVDWSCSWTILQHCAWGNWFGQCLGESYYPEGTPATDVNIEILVTQGGTLKDGTVQGGIVKVDKILDPYALTDTISLDSNNQITIRGNGVINWKKMCSPLMDYNTIFVKNTAAESTEVTIRDTRCISEEATKNQILTTLAGVPMQPLQWPALIYNLFRTKNLCPSKDFSDNYANATFHPSITVSGIKGNERLSATPTFSLGSAQFIIYANANYIGKYTYTPATTVTPDIQPDPICSKSIASGSSGGAKVTVINTKAGTSGQVYVKVQDTGGFDVQPTMTAQSLLTDKLDYSFTLNHPKGGTADEKRTITFIACSSNEINQICSEPKSCEVIAGKEGSMTIPTTCPDSICESFESFSSCPQDCIETKPTTCVDTCTEAYKIPLLNTALPFSGAYCSLKCNGDQIAKYLMWGAIILIIIIILVIVLTGTKSGGGSNSGRGRMPIISGGGGGGGDSIASFLAGMGISQILNRPVTQTFTTNGAPGLRGNDLFKYLDVKSMNSFSIKNLPVTLLIIGIAVYLYYSFVNLVPTSYVDEIIVGVIAYLISRKIK